MKTLQPKYARIIHGGEREYYFLCATDRGNGHWHSEPDGSNVKFAYIRDRMDEGTKLTRLYAAPADLFGDD